MSEAIPPDVRERFPLITPAGVVLLRALEEHPQAPRWTHPGVNRLSAPGLARVRDYEAEVLGVLSHWPADAPPAWAAGFAAECYAQAPLYRRRGPAPADWAAIPTTSRADLAREPWAWVPDETAVDGLTVYHTSGATGHPLSILTNGDVLAHYLPLMRGALAAHGVTLTGGAGRVAVALVAHQLRTYTYAAISAVLDQAGFVKVNLHPTEWRDPADRARYLDAWAPEVITGDPLAFAVLAELPLAHRPKALISTAMTLLPGMRDRLAARFGCPVIDVYGLNEAGPVAVRLPEGRWRLLQPRLYVEVLDAAGRPCAPGVRGELTLTGGFNPFLPLLRYRTGDYAALVWEAGRPGLADLEGRAPVTFRAADGRQVNNIDVSLALRDLPMPQFALHQTASGALVLRLREADAGLAHSARAALLALFGAAADLTLAPWTEPVAGKPLQYTSDLEPTPLTP